MSSFQLHFNCILAAGGGGSYGGAGGLDTTAFYAGSLWEANLFGSGGGDGADQTGGAGGGRVTFEVAETLTLDGTVSANGEEGGTTGGGGAGGSILVEVPTLIGSGSIQVCKVLNSKLLHLWLQAFIKRIVIVIFTDVRIASAGVGRLMAEMQKAAAPVAVDVSCSTSLTRSRTSEAMTSAAV